MGRPQTLTLSQNLKLGQEYRTYLLCRSTQRYVFNKRDRDTSTTKYMSHTTGYSHLPKPGGIEEQSQRTMVLFQAFRDGEDRAEQELLYRH